MGNPFKKARQPQPSNQQIVVLALHTRLEGSIQTESSVLINGHVDGDITTTGRVVVGSTGVVGGNIIAAELEIYGTVYGEMQANSITLSLRSNHTRWKLNVESIEETEQ